MKKIIVLILIALFFSSGTALALTDEETMSRISALEQELSFLRASLATSTPFVTSCHKGILFGWDYCKSDCPCETGEGDCDGPQHCLSGYCAYDVGKKYGKESTLDVCEQPPAKAQAPTVIIPAVFDENNLITVKGRVVDIDTKEPVQAAILYLGGQELSRASKGGIFEIKLDKRFSLGKDIQVKSSEHMKSVFSACQNCKGYDLAVVVSPVEGADIVFPVFGSKIEIGDIKIKKAFDVKIFSGRFIKAYAQYEKSSGNFVETASFEAYSQAGDLLEALPLDYSSRIVLLDKQGNKYLTKVPKAEGQMTLSFVSGDFLFGVCGNGVCEKEESTCKEDCVSACKDSKEQGDNKCTFGCEGDKCKSDVSLSFPNQKAEFEPGKTYEIEWAQVGLENESMDVELLAFSREGELVQGFKYIIATSVPASSGEYSWKVPENIAKNPNYKIVVYNKMCSESGETLVSCLKERYLDKSDDFFALKEKEVPLPFGQAQLASISQAALFLADKVKSLLGR